MRDLEDVDVVRVADRVTLYGSFPPGSVLMVWFDDQGGELAVWEVANEEEAFEYVERWQSAKGNRG